MFDDAIDNSPITTGKTTTNLVGDIDGKIMLFGEPFYRSKAFFQSLLTYSHSSRNGILPAAL